MCAFPTSFFVLSFRARGGYSCVIRYELTAASELSFFFIIIGRERDERRQRGKRLKGERKEAPLRSCVS